MELEDKIIEVKNQIKQKLDENNIRITSISAYFFADRLQQDGLTKKDSIVVRVGRPLFGKYQSIIVDPNTLEVLYIQTDVMRFMSPENYFTPRESIEE